MDTWKSFKIAKVEVLLISREHDCCRRWWFADIPCSLSIPIKTHIRNLWWWVVFWWMTTLVRRDTSLSDRARELISKRLLSSSVISSRQNRWNFSLLCRDTNPEAPLVVFHLGWVLIDRDGKHFYLVLNYLRDGTINLPECTQTLNELLQEAKFYCIESLIELIEQQLKTRSRRSTGDTESCCKVIMLTSAKELPNIVATVRKPIVKLAINRHNNKYSYTA